MSVLFECNYVAAVVLPHCPCSGAGAGAVVVYYRTRLLVLCARACDRGDGASVKSLANIREKSQFQSRHTDSDSDVKCRDPFFFSSLTAWPS